MVGDCRRCGAPVPKSARIDFTITMRAAPEQEQPEFVKELGLEPNDTVKCVSYACPGCRGVVCEPDNGGPHFNLQAENADGEIEFVEA